VAVTSRMQQILQMLADEPNDPELRYMLAMEHAGSGDDEGAVRCFQELLSANPDYAPAYHQGARALQRLDRIREARDLLQRGVPVAMTKGDQHAAEEMQELLASLEEGL